MPVIKSAIKRARQTEKRRAHNLAFKNDLKAAVKAVTDAAQAKDKQGLAQKLQRAQSLLDKAVKKNVYHRNKAARKKAQLSRLVAGLGVKPAPAKKTPAKKAPAAKKTAAKKSTTKKPSATKKSTAKKPAAKQKSSK